MNANATQDLNNPNDPDSAGRVPGSVPPVGEQDGHDIDELTRNISRAFTARGNAHRDNGEYDLAIRDYGQAIRHRPASFPLHAMEYNPEAAENREEAILWLHDNLAGIYKNAKLPNGYLVAGNGAILFECPLTAEGEQAARGYADKLAHDVCLRMELDNLYLVDDTEFDTVVYRHDEHGSTEIHRVAPGDEEEEDSSID